MKNNNKDFMVYKKTFVGKISLNCKSTNKKEYFIIVSPFLKITNFLNF
jgi:hypothetical protein